MSGYWWFDAFAYIGMGCVAGAGMSTVYMFVSEFRAKRKFSKETRDFHKQMNALFRAWDGDEK